MTRLLRQPEPNVLELPEEAAAYAHAELAEVNQAFVDCLLAMAGEAPAARCIDLGTGPADIPIRLVRARPEWRVVAVDTSRPMLSCASLAVSQAGLDQSIQTMLADARETGLPPKTFDVIMSNSILHHIEDTLRFWQEVRRLGRSGALVLVRDLRRPDCQDEARQLVEQYAASESTLLQADYYRSLLAAYTVEEVVGQLASAGVGELEALASSDRHLDVRGRLR